jgi:hypothetical protein
MSHETQNTMTGLLLNEECANTRGEFSAYLDGAMSGVEMTAMVAHLENCGECVAEFDAWQDVQSALVQFGPAQAPAQLQARLRTALAGEAERGTHLTWISRLKRAWEPTVAPLVLRVSGGLAAAILLVGSLGYVFAAPIAVQANDDGLADLRAPRYLYSQVPALPIETKHDVPVVVEAKVDASGRVYDFTLLEGPSDDAKLRSVLSQNLLASIFRPAMVFGTPVPGRVVLTFTGVSVHG